MGEQKFFVTLWEGNIAPSDIVVKMTSNSLMRTAESEAWIEAEWQKLLRSGFKAWPNDTKPTRYRFCDARDGEGKLMLALDPCVSYRDFAGSCSPEFLRQFGALCNPHPVAVSVVIVTSDQKILLTVRKNVDYKAGGYHASIGGFMDIRKEDNPISAMYRETKEECGVKDEEIINPRCISVTYNPWSLHTDIIFSATVTVASNEIQQRQKDDENESLFFIPSSRQSIEELLVRTSHANVIIATAGLLALGKSLPVQHGEDECPEDWYDRMLAVLAYESRNYYSAEARTKLEARDIARFQSIVRQGLV